ncbi:MAG: class I SAM-dependent methyltransferase, partial [Candidatus Eisenbacteria bacterium]|nr:class I SAM-dependent methyltransferase [Candidatus Eisenbacteria bacterium]
VPGGRLVVLEAAAPAPGPLAPFTGWWIRNMIPLAGRISPDPTAYKYLAESIFEFGSGPEFEADLATAGFRVVERRSFLFGASRLWVAESRPAVGQNPTEAGHGLHVATSGPGDLAQSSDAGIPAIDEAGTWAGVQALTSTLLAGALGWAFITWLKVRDHLPLTPPQRMAAWVLLVAGLIVFGARAALQILRWSALRGGGGSRS